MKRTPRRQTGSQRRRWPGARAFLSLIVATGLAGSAVGTVAAPSLAAADCSTGFERVSTTAAINPEGVLGLGQKRAIVAGGVHRAGGTRLARISTFSPSTGWRSVQTVGRGGDAGFSGIGGSVATGLWVAGFSQTKTRMRPLVLRRPVGGRWIEGSPGTGGPKSAVLTDIDSFEKGTAWAVGYSLDRPGSYQPYAARWRSGAWKMASPPLARGERGELTSVSTSRSGGIWVAGSTIKGRVVRPFIARRENGHWRRMTLPAVGSGVLTDVTVPDRDTGFAVGYRYAGAGIRPLAMRWDGRRWRTIVAPLPGRTALLYAVSAPASGAKVTVVGSQLRAQSGLFRPLIAQRAAGRWRDASAWKATNVAGLSVDGLVTGISGRWFSGRDLATGLVGRTCAPFVPTVAQRVSDPGSATAHPLEPLAAPPSRLAPARHVRISSGDADVSMRDVTRSVGLPTTSTSYGAVVADFDGDGRDDIFLGAHGARPSLYLDRGDTYVKADRDFGTGDRHGCAAADIDGSGLPDLYCSFGGARGQNVKGNELYLDPGGRMRTRPGAGGAAEPLGRGRAVIFLDYDRDGRKDLVLGQQPERMDGVPSMTRVYRRTGAATFSPVIDSGLPPLVGITAWDAGDVDGDGRVDLLMVTNDPRAKLPAQSIRLFRNTASGFRPIHTSMGIRRIGDRDAGLVDLDGDHRLDLVQLSGDRIRVSLQRQGRFVKAWERSLSGGAAFATGDADGDGDQDIYILRKKSRPDITDVVLFNDGRGSAFSVVAAPTRAGGVMADDVVAIDHDQNGLMDFLALNGRGGDGPVQLTAFYRR